MDKLFIIALFCVALQHWHAPHPRTEPDDVFINLALLHRLQTVTGVCITLGACKYQTFIMSKICLTAQCSMDLGSPSTYQCRDAIQALNPSAHVILRKDSDTEAVNYQSFVNNLQTLIDFPYCVLSSCSYQFISGEDHLNQCAQASANGLSLNVNTNTCNLGQMDFSISCLVNHWPSAITHQVTLSIMDRCYDVNFGTSYVLPALTQHDTTNDEATHQISKKVLFGIESITGNCNVGGCQVFEGNCAAASSTPSSLISKILELSLFSLVVNTALPTTESQHCLVCRTNEQVQREQRLTLTQTIIPYDCRSLCTIASLSDKTVLQTSNPWVDVVMPGFVSCSVCPILGFELRQSGAIYSGIDLKLDPATGLLKVDTTLKVQIQDLSLRVLLKNGFFKQSNPFLIQVGCLPNWILKAAAGALQIKAQTALITTNMVEFEVQKITPLQHECKVMRVFTTESPTKPFVESSKFGDVKGQTLTKDVYTLKLDRMLTNTKAVHEFYIVVEFDGGSQSLLGVGAEEQTKFSLKLECAPTSTVVSEGPSPVFSQIKDKLETNGFESTVYVSSDPQCLILSAIPSISSLRDGVQLAGGGFVFKPTDWTKDQVFEFFVKVNAEGGASFMSAQYKYIHGCPPEVIVATEDPLFIKELHHAIGDSSVSVYQIKPPVISPSYCKIKSFKVVDEQIDGLPATETVFIDYSQCILGILCDRLDFKVADRRQLLSFKIMTLVDGGFTALSSPIIIKTVCDQRLNKMTSNVIQSTFKIEQYQAMVINLKNFGFTCSPLDCCSGIEFEPLIINNRVGFANISELVSLPFFDAASGSQVVQVFTGKRGLIEFQLVQKIPYQVSVTSATIQVHVIYDCRMLQVFANPKPPTDKENLESQFPKEAEFVYDRLSSKSLFLFNASVGSFKKVSFDLSQRVANNASEFCSMQKFEILKVVDLATGVAVDRNRAKLFVELNQNGVVTLNEFGKARNFEVFLAASNEYKKFEIKHPILVVNIFQPHTFATNFAPIFDGILEVTEINLDNPEKAFELIQLPAILDPESDSNVEVSIEPPRVYLKFLRGSNQIEIDLAAVPNSDLKLIKFGLRLVDSQGASRVVDLAIKFVKSELWSNNSTTIIVKNQNVVGQSLYGTGDETDQLELRFEAMSANGVVSLLFSYEVFLLSDFNLSISELNLNKTDFLQIDYERRNISEEDLPQLTNWYFQSVDQSRIKISLNFSNAMSVSTGRRDLLRIRVLNNTIYRRTLDRGFLLPNQTLEIIVPPQAKSELSFFQITTFSGGAENSMIATLVVPLVFMLFKSLNMSTVWSLYNMMQVISTSTFMLGVIMPSPADVTLQTMRGVCYFNILQQPLVQIWLKQNVFGRFKGLQDFFQEMDVGLIASLSCFIVILLIVVLKKFITSQKLQAIQDKLMWSSILRSTIQTYLPTAINNLGFIKQLMSRPLQISPLLAFIPKFVLIIAVPIFSVWFLRKNRKKLKKQKMKMGFSPLYENVNTRHRKAVLYISFFCLRRFLLGVVIVFLDWFPVGQLAVYLASILMMLTYHSVAKPMDGFRLNKVETLNEILVLFTFYFFIFFTNWCPNVELAYFVSELLMIFVGLVLLINFLLVIEQLCYPILLRFKRQQARLKRYFAQKAKNRLVESECKEKEPEKLDEIKSASPKPQLPRPNLMLDLNKLNMQDENNQNQVAPKHKQQITSKRVHDNQMIQLPYYDLSKYELQEEVNPQQRLAENYRYRMSMVNRFDKPQITPRFG